MYIDTWVSEWAKLLVGKKLPNRIFSEQDLFLSGCDIFTQLPYKIRNILKSHGS